MADVNKPKLQLRSGATVNGDKTPSPATKLLINHGKPNFTIQRSPKIQNGNDNLMSPPLNDEFVVKSTKFNGVFKPSNISVATKQSLQQQQQQNGSGDNEASKVVLRRAKVVEAELKEGEDENVPEFIRRQRRIQERLANQNVLDFENRRSGYFTHVMISPTNPNRQSFVETMASPAVMPSLEIPPPAAQPEQIKEDQQQEESTDEYKEEYVQEVVQEQEHVVPETVLTVPVALNVHDDEEVAKAIEEVNKAVEGEDDDKTEVEDTPVVAAAVATSALELEATVEKAPLVGAAVTSALEVVEEQPLQNGHAEAAVTSAAHIEEHVEEPKTNDHVEAVATSAALTEEHVEEPKTNDHVEVVVTSAALTEEHVEEPNTNDHEEVVVTSAAVNEEHVEAPKTNGVVEETVENGHANVHASDSEVTISHTNGLNRPSIPSPDPSGEKGVNFEPKTVVSFSQEMGSEVNKYPDTVKVMKDADTPVMDEEIKELTKLKFEIKTDADDIEVKSVLITEKA